MDLKRKFLLRTFLLLAGTLAVGLGSLYGLAGGWRDARSALAEYAQVDRAEALGVDVGRLRDQMLAPNAVPSLGARNIKQLAQDVDEIAASLGTLAARSDEGDTCGELRYAQVASRNLNDALAHTSTPDGGGKPDIAGAADHLQHAHKALMNLASLGPGSLRHREMGQTMSTRNAFQLALLLLVIAMAVSIVVSVMQYRASIVPLHRLRDEMRRSTRSGYASPVQTKGDAEFADLALEYNKVASEILGLYRNMEEKVAARSRELVRSERLASVGFLAAGVAHELNNPLSVISGYAELTSKRLGRPINAEAVKESLVSLGVIRDEAFRCKDITGRLLSLARGGEDSREVLPLHELTRQVATLVKGLKSYRDRTVELAFDDADDSLEVVANATEMKQVLLNLVVNALEAISPAQGIVRIEGSRRARYVEITVIDNGRGMSAEVLKHVFEPFFTAKRGAGEPGTGLGLTITHAIVESHGGTMSALSAGPGLGSRFTVTLPAAPRSIAPQQPGRESSREGGTPNDLQRAANTRTVVEAAP
jgi:signal transduction histidine kinase